MAKVRLLIFGPGRGGGAMARYARFLGHDADLVSHAEADAGPAALAAEWAKIARDSRFSVLASVFRFLYRAPLIQESPGPRRGEIRTPGSGFFA
ncbi:MAG: hypothetical protein KDA46_01470 [Parvularculaceae bacterium]|nr:hypothetical protein [Parvularculaceae bacterium]